MNQDVFRAILAMDSYNRGYGQGVKINSADSVTGQAEVGRQLGNATIIAQNITQSAKDVGFYASAYLWDGVQVISYRGTNFDIDWSISEFVNSPAVKDIWNGWTVGAELPAISP